MCCEASTAFWFPKFLSLVAPSFCSHAVFWVGKWVYVCLLFLFSFSCWCFFFFCFVSYKRQNGHFCKKLAKLVCTEVCSAWWCSTLYLWGVRWLSDSRLTCTQPGKDIWWSPVTFKCEKGSLVTEPPVSAPRVAIMEQASVVPFIDRSV